MDNLSVKEKEQFGAFSEAVEELTQQQILHNRCQSWKSKLLQSSPILTFLFSELDKTGAKFNPKFITCAPCGPDRAGGFAPKFGIVLCENQLVSRGHLEDTLAHELIHAYDHATVQLDWNSPLHLACTEIRAANLSRECAFTREIKRGNFGIAKQHQSCVQRRALLMQAGYTKETADESIRVVWDSCFKDTAPFDEIY
jgi:mitochondrial inner membrane protease ATP23